MIGSTGRWLDHRRASSSSAASMTGDLGSKPGALQEAGPCPHQRQQVRNHQRIGALRQRSDRLDLQFTHRIAQRREHRTDQARRAVRSPAPSTPSG